MLTRRRILGLLGAGALLRAAETPSLVEDARFARGLRVLEATPGVRRPAGSIQPPGASGGPVWSAAQWYSRYNLAAARSERMPSGSTRFFDGAKAVTFGAPGSVEEDIILALNGHTEYGERAPEKGQPWPHLLVEEELTAHPRLSGLRSVPFGIEYRLLKSDAFHLPGWDEHRHTAQFVLYLTIQNGNRESAGFGDYLWFGVPMYDARYRLPMRHTAPDRGTALKRGTGKFIFNPAGEAYASKPAKDGDWVSIDRDLLPLMRESVEAAWSAGYLPGSHKTEDYPKIGS